MPDLHGREFRFQYAKPADIRGYPIPLPLNIANNKYSEPVIVNRLSSNIVRHLSSDNLAFKASLEPTIRPEPNVQSVDQFSTFTPVLNRQSFTAFRHNSRLKQRVRQYSS